MDHRRRIIPRPPPISSPARYDDKPPSDVRKNQYRFQAAKRLTAQVSDTAVRERLLEMAEE